MAAVTTESLLLASLVGNEEYFGKVVPFLKPEYFEDPAERSIYTIIKNYSNKHSESPDFTILRNVVTNCKKSEEEISSMLETIDTVKNVSVPNNLTYLLNEAEKFCKERAVFCAISKSFDIYEGSDATLKIEAIPEILREAICVNFDSSVGHEYDEDAESRWDYYNSVEAKIAFESAQMNRITNGGIPRKTFNIIAAGVNVGKTMTLVWLAAMYKRMGYNVLYITNEVSEKELAQRIDASMLDIDTDQIKFMTKAKYFSRIEKLKESQHGRLFIHEFATGTCSSDKVETLLRDLALKKKFKPDVIINDYITINISSRISYGGNMGDYYTKVAEEMRATAVRHDCIMWSAAQMVTAAMESTDPNLSDLGMSQGIAKTADLVWCVSRTEELDAIGQIAFKQLKTRYHKDKIVRWLMGVDVGKQKFIEMDTNVSSSQSYTTPVKEKESIETSTGTAGKMKKKMVV